MKPLHASWLYGSNEPNNPEQFELIRQWWLGLAGQPVTWRQRLLDGGREARDLDWAPERFDEEFELGTTDVRGITFYCQKSGNAIERNHTPQRLELDIAHDQLYLFPQSQPDVVIRVGRPTVDFQTLNFNDPQVDVATGSGRCWLTLTDVKEQITVRVSLSAEALYALKKQLP